MELSFGQIGTQGRVQVQALLLLGFGRGAGGRHAQGQLRRAPAQLHVGPAVAGASWP